MKKIMLIVIVVRSLEIYTGDFQDRWDRAPNRKPSKPINETPVTHYGDQTGWQSRDNMRALLNSHIIMGFELGLKTILECKLVDINAKDPNGQTALQLATEYGRPNIIELLKKHGAIDPAAQSNNNAAGPSLGVRRIDQISNHNDTKDSPSKRLRKALEDEDDN